MKQPIVNHIIRVSIDLAAYMMAGAVPHSRLTNLRLFGGIVNNRLHQLADALEQLTASGFSVEWEKGIINAYSRKATPYETKKLLAECGLQDRDFRIYLEYERSWGIL